MTNEDKLALAQTLAEEFLKHAVQKTQDMNLSEGAKSAIIQHACKIIVAVQISMLPIDEQNANIREMEDGVKDLVKEYNRITRLMN